MADNSITVLPTAAKVPLPKRRWYGTYPRGVFSIAVYKREKKYQAFLQQHQQEKPADPIQVELDRYHTNLDMLHRFRDISALCIDEMILARNRLEAMGATAIRNHQGA